MNTVFINEGMQAVKVAPVFSVEDFHEAYATFNDDRKLTPELIEHAETLFKCENGHMPDLFKGNMVACAFEVFLMNANGEKV